MALMVLNGTNPGGRPIVYLANDINISKDKQMKVTKYESQHLMKPYYVHPDKVDCNDCPCISITEREQDEWRRRTPISERAYSHMENHFCKKYEKKLFHAGRNAKVTPCKECYDMMLKVYNSQEGTDDPFR